MSTNEQPTTLPPRVRRNYTQGANGQWRGEFTVESHLDPGIPVEQSLIEAEDEGAARAVLAMLAQLNRKGNGDE